MSNPLEKQVGGTHYKTQGVQHVQFCQRNKIPWCEACALKYLIRHRGKNKLQDLEKAKHYLELCCQEEYILKDGEFSNLDRMNPKSFVIPLDQLIEDNNVPKREAEIMRMIVSHKVKHGEALLLDAIKSIDKLIQSCKAEEVSTSLLS